MTEKKYKKKIIQSVDKFFIENGFSIHSLGLADYMGYGDDKINDYVQYGFGLNYSRTSFEDTYTGGIHSSRKIKVIDDFWLDLKEKYNLFGLATTISVFPQDENNNYLTKFEFLKEEYDKKGEAFLIQESFQKTINFYMDIIFPLLEKTSNIHYLDNNYNVPFDKRIEAGEFQKMIVAKLSGNPEFNEIYNHSMAFYERLRREAITKEDKKECENYKEALSILYKRLKNVKPLTDPYLGSGKHPFFDRKNKLDQLTLGF